MQARTQVKVYGITAAPETSNHAAEWLTSVVSRLPKEKQQELSLVHFRWRQGVRVPDSSPVIAEYTAYWGVPPLKTYLTSGEDAQQWHDAIAAVWSQERQGVVNYPVAWKLLAPLRASREAATQLLTLLADEGYVSGASWVRSDTGWTFVSASCVFVSGAGGSDDAGWVDDATLDGRVDRMRYREAFETLFEELFSGANRPKRSTIKVGLLPSPATGDAVHVGALEATQATFGSRLETGALQTVIESNTGLLALLGACMRGLH